MSTLNVNNITKYTGGEVVVNDASEDVDFRVESNGNANMLFVDGGNNTVGINEASNTRAFFQVTADVAVAADACRLEGNSANGIPLVLDNLRADAASEHTIHFFRDGSRFAAIGGTDTSLQFFNASAVTMQIDSTGAVTKPLQPAFLAIRSTGNQSNLSNGDVITFDTETFDNNADFASNTFTAPITGKYQFGFIVSVQSLDYNATFNRIELVSSNKTFNFGITSEQMFDDADPTYFSFQGSLLIDMDASDTCKLQWGQSGGSAQADTFDSTYFSGYLVC